MKTEALVQNEPFLRPEEMDEIRRVFFDQGNGAVESLNHAILTLEGEIPTAERLRPLRRSAHTLKGDCASVGFPGLSRLCHALEDALVAIETSPRPVSAAQTDVLLEAIDLLHSGLAAGTRGEAEPAVESCVARLGSIRQKDDSLLAVHHQGLIEGRARGLHPVRVGISFAKRCRNKEKTVREVMKRLQLETLAAAPPLGTIGRARDLQLIGLAREDAATLTARLRASRSVRVVVQDVPDMVAAPAAPARSGEPANEGETIRIESPRVDEVLNLVGEMVIARSAIARVAAEIEARVPEDLALRMADAQAVLARVLQDLQRSAMRMRMVPAERVFQRFTRVVRDLARKTGKRVSLKIEGENTELDRGVLEALEEPLLHLVRNAVDHGVERPAERREKGKPDEARVSLRAWREGNQILIEVADDGRGIDAAAVRARAVANGLVSQADAAAMGDEDALQLVFEPGLSTASQVTETSGRGVGLDIVRDAVESLKGSVRATNLPRQGAAFLIRVPLTVAIIQALLFTAGGRHLAVPLTSVVEIARAADLPSYRLEHGEAFRLREEVLGLVRVSDLLDVPPPRSRSPRFARTSEREQGGTPGFTPGVPNAGAVELYVIVLQSGGGRFGLLVDGLNGEHELVIKAVHDRWIKTPLVAGASVLGSGVLVLILDVASLYRAALARGVRS